MLSALCNCSILHSDVFRCFVDSFILWFSTCRTCKYLGLTIHCLKKTNKLKQHVYAATKRELWIFWSVYSLLLGQQHHTCTPPLSPPPSPSIITPVKTYDLSEFAQLTLHAIKFQWDETMKQSNSYGLNMLVNANWNGTWTQANALQTEL